MTGAPLVTWTVQGEPYLWLGHHNAQVVCWDHATAEQRRWGKMTAGELFDFEYDMGQRIVTIAECRARRVILC